MIRFKENCRKNCHEMGRRRRIGRFDRRHARLRRAGKNSVNQRGGDSLKTKLGCPIAKKWGDTDVARSNKQKLGKTR